VGNSAFSHRSFSLRGQGGTQQAGGTILHMPWCSASGRIFAM